MEEFDYIILGGGASGLSLAYRMMKDSFFNTSKIAIIERENKKKNDRTWCYWEKGEGIFDDVVCKKWSEISFFSKKHEVKQSILPYQYKMISGLDFYQFVIPQLKNSANIRFISGEVIDIAETKEAVKIKTSVGDFTSSQVFKSYPSIDMIDPDKYIHVEQHFKGFFIETEAPFFDPGCATFMDFRIEQRGDTRFLYVLPESATKALVEVALFSNELLSEKEYKGILQDYIRDFLKIESYIIHEEEFGVIPMSAYDFAGNNTDRIFHIGTGGGIVKASSGYAFHRIQKHSDRLVQCIKKGRRLESSYRDLHGRHLFYDKIMLHAMLYNGVKGEELFTKLFQNLSAQKIFKFLDQETSFFEELEVFTAPPLIPFTKSFFQVLSKK